jgi:hypothetical protein
LRKQIGEAKARLKKIDGDRDAAWSAHANGNATGEQLQERLTRLDAERSALVSVIADLEGQIGAATASVLEGRTAGELIRHATTVWGRAEPEDQRKLARAVARALGGIVLRKPMAFSLATPS